MAITLVDDTLESNNSKEHDYPATLNEVNILKAFIIELQDKIFDLKEDITFLREDSSNKNTIINNLLAITRQAIGNESSHDNSSDNVSDYNKGVSFYNKNSRNVSKVSFTSSNILEDLMSTPVKKRGNVNNEFTFHSFPLFVESLEDDTSGEVSNTTSEFTVVDEMDDKDDEEKEQNEQENDDVEGDGVVDDYKEDHTMTSIPPWEKYTNGCVSRIMEKMGYRGKGLGKTESGITEPIKVQKKGSFVTGQPIDAQKRKFMCVLSDSMMNQIDEKRIGTDVKVMCHGGCTIQCMYRHLPKVIKRNPKYVLLHIGTNDCVGKTSDEVLRELVKLHDYIETAIHDCTVIISMPTMRTDDLTANQIIQNLNVKLKKTNYHLLDNCNISKTHLGRKGLHLGEHGTRKIAHNLISLIKRL